MIAGAAAVDNWPTEDEEGLTPSQVVSLGKALAERGSIVLGYDRSGFIAVVDGNPWGPYVLLSELLEDIADR